MTCSSSVARSAPASIEAAMSAAVLRPIMSKYSSTDMTSSASLVALSMYWLAPRRPGQRSAVVTGDRGVGQEAQERPHPLARQAVGAIKAKVVAALLVDADRRGVSVADEAEDLRFGVRDELGEVELRGSGGHRGGSVALPDQTCEVQVACCAGDLSARCRPDSVVLPSESCPLP